MDDATRWALRAAQGDPSAATAFVRATQADVWRLCAGLVDPGAADDLTQETYLRAFRGLAGFEARASARTWLLGVARRACMDHLRMVVRQRRTTDTAAPVPDRADPAADPGGRVGADDLVARLDPDRRTAFVLTQLVGLSYAEAAEVAGVPVGTIRSRVARAREDLIGWVAAAEAG
ncbi:MAG: sigma-70 family RNA polymerase sigma factor [Mycobacteriales bacterium]